MRAAPRGWWGVLCLDPRRQVGELVQGVGPLPALLVACSASLGSSVLLPGPQSPQGQFLPCCEQGHWEEDVRLKSQTPTPCMQQQLTECTCN